MVFLRGAGTRLPSPGPPITGDLVSTPDGRRSSVIGVHASLEYAAEPGAAGSQGLHPQTGGSNGHGRRGRAVAPAGVGSEPKGKKLQSDSTPPTSKYRPTATRPSVLVHNNTPTMHYTKQASGQLQTAPKLLKLDPHHLGCSTYSPTPLNHL